MTQLASWREAGLDISVAVNLSASDLLDESLAERIAGLLAEHAVPAGALELEITESVLMIDPQRAREVLEALRALGLRIAVDDYGTGYCALAYLRDLPIDELKIDRTFIAQVTTDPRSAAIVRSTIELAHALGLKVVAEGVEDKRRWTPSPPSAATTRRAITSAARCPRTRSPRGRAREWPTPRGRCSPASARSRSGRRRRPSAAAVRGRGCPRAGSGAARSRSA